MRILAATNNKHKIEEFRSILGGLLDIIAPSEIGGIPDFPETGSTFEENAFIKAHEAAKFANMTVFADDSGLEVEALDGRPGIYSARYADSNDKRIARVLSELGNCENRKARFVCVIALSNPEVKIASFMGEVRGRICFEPKGNAGFGYDPVFIPDGYELTFGELGPEIKDRISHRANALMKMKEYIEGKGIK